MDARWGTEKEYIVKYSGKSHAQLVHKGNKCHVLMQNMQLYVINSFDYSNMLTKR